jgi:regulator of MON1-CCZ1 complex
MSYNVLHESKPLACFLMSLANHDPLISQMAMDMLKRLNSHEIIVEILLEQGKVIDAMRLTKQYTNIDFISARKFLEAAWKSDDKMTFYSVFNFLTARNLRLRGNADFLKGKLLD